MAQILALPLELRLAILFVLGCALGSLCNWAVYRFAYQRRFISPWSPPLRDAPKRRWSDRLPVLGWWGLRREEKLHGAGFWVRPMLVELFTGLLLAALYWWETVEFGLLLPPVPAGIRAAGIATVHAEYLAHTVLCLFMLVASLIDYDERTIPDSITIPGTLLGLLLIAVLPQALLPHFVVNGVPPVLALDVVTLASPNNWPAVLNGAPEWRSLLVGLGCYLLWCFALLPRSWRSRHGYGRALRIFVARIVREPFSLLVAALAVAGCAAITGVWWLAGSHWEGLLSSLVGMAVGGGMIWTVRIIGKLALGREAMGFGDVTLMAMIGAYLGWQACLFVFFLAPFAGVVLGVIQWIARRENELYYGPFLCLAALITIWNWAALWDWGRPVFGIGWLVPAAIAACMAMMLVLLRVIRWLRGG